MNQPFNFPIPELQWYSVIPVAILAIVGMLALTMEMLRPRHRNDLIVALSLGGLALAGFVLVTQLENIPEATMAGAIYRDRFGTALQILIVIATAICVLFSEPYLRERKIPHGEFYPLVLWSAVGAMLMVATKNLLVIFIGLEILSIALYVMAGMARQEKSEESAMKYFLLGAFASAFLLFGIAFYYGGTGSLAIDDLSLSWRRNVEGTRPLILFGMAMMLIGLGFKASFVPFHQWTPDVYEGAPTNVTAYMATTAKIGALGATWRILSEGLLLREFWLLPLSYVAAATMLVGNLVALTQKDVKRILAYSSIANAGYVLVGILAGTSRETDQAGVAITYFLLGYSVVTCGAFAVLSLAAKDGREATSLDDIKGLWQRSPFAAITLVLCMLSLIGVPPTAGFFGKLLIFQDAVRAGLTPLALILALSSAISIYYYLQIGTAAFATNDENADRRLAPASPALLGACALCIGGILTMTLAFGPIIDAIRP